jgi:hypothetical protein
VVCENAGDLAQSAYDAGYGGPIMNMHPPPLVAQVEVQQVQQGAGEPLQLTPPEDQPPAPVAPAPIKVDVSQYIPVEAKTATIVVSLTPPTGQALVYTEGSEGSGTIFKGAKSVGDIPLDGRYIYVKLYGATSFSIQYVNYRIP